MAVLVAIAAFVIVLAALTALAWRSQVHPTRLHRRLSDAAGGLPVLVQEAKPSAAAPLAHLMENLGRLLPASPADQRSLRAELQAAGWRGENSLYVFYGLRALAAASVFLLVLMVRDNLTSAPVIRVLLLPAGAAAGFAMARMVLDRLVKKRRERLRLSLPDALDLMVISVEAGMGLDQAMQNVSRELALTHRDISEELGLMMLEMRAGKRRAEALRNLAERTGEPEIGKLVGVLVQSDRFGTSMGEALRAHSDFMRVRRRQEAEERAAKVGVKLVFPIFFFILPSMMVVAAGPGLLQLFKNLFPMMKGF